MMSVEQVDSYLKHPLFHLAMRSMQKGEWQAALSQFEELSQHFPLESELRAVRQEMLLRTKIDQDEREDNTYLRRRRIKNLAISLGALASLAVLAFFLVTSYWRWINDQVNLARQTVESQMLSLDLAVKFRDAQDYLRAGQTETALALLNEIAIADPNYPGLIDLATQAQYNKMLAERYNEAIAQAAQGNVEAALQIYREIEQEEPFYRDVKFQIQAIDKRTVLGGMLASADQAFEASDWLEAATRYEQLYVFNPDFETSYVEDRLFTSYVKAAEMNLHGSESLEAIQAAEDYYRKALSLRPQEPATKARQEQVRSLVEERLFYGYISLAQRALADEPDSLQALNLANQYFMEALKIRPNDPEVAAQGELAYRYIQALDYYSGENWGAAIDNLEYIYSQNTGYAGGTARQVLYEAHVARGNDEMAIGQFDEALADFQRGAVLAQDDPSSKSRVYEIQLKIAEVAGLLGDYEEAVRLYKAAIDLAGLEERSQENGTLADALATAAVVADQGNYREAYRYYRDAVTGSTVGFEVVTHVVESGEYLSSIARDYGSTVSLIAAANNLNNPNLIITGQTLMVPILP